MPDPVPHQLDYASARVDGFDTSSRLPVTVTEMDGVWTIEVHEPSTPHEDDEGQGLGAAGLGAIALDGLVVLFLPLLLLVLALRWLVACIRPERADRREPDELVTFEISAEQICISPRSGGFSPCLREESWPRASVLELRRSRTRNAILINVEGLKDHVTHQYPEHVLGPLERALERAMTATEPISERPATDPA